MGKPRKWEKEPKRWRWQGVGGREKCKKEIEAEEKYRNEAVAKVSVKLPKVNKEIIQRKKKRKKDYDKI